MQAMKYMNDSLILRVLTIPEDIFTSSSPNTVVLREQDITENLSFQSGHFECSSLEQIEANGYCSCVVFYSRNT